MFVEVFIQSLPFFLGIFLGFAASFAPSFQKHVEPALTTYVFYIGLPALLFSLTIDADLSAGIPGTFVWLTIASVILFFVFQFFISWAVHRRPVGENLTLTMAGSYGNVAYLGIPLVIGVLGQPGALPIVIGQLIHNLLFLLGYPLLAAVVLRNGRSPEDRNQQLKDEIKKATLKSPLMWAVVVGLSLGLLRFPMPEVLLDFTNMFAGSAAPVALFAIGLTLRRALKTLGPQGAAVGPAVTASIGKLVFMPVITALLALPFAIDGPWLFTLVLMAAMPTSASAYVVAAQSYGDARGTATVILITNFFALFTIPLSTFLLP